MPAARPATRSGFELPLDRLRRQFALSPTEARVVEILVALELVATVRELATPYLDKAGMATVELIEALAYRTNQARGATGEELSADGRLFRYQLASLGGNDLPWLARPIKIPRRASSSSRSDGCASTRRSARSERSSSSPPPASTCSSTPRRVLL